MTYNGTDEPEELVDKLFYDYIGYKFDNEEKETTLSKLIQKTESIVIKEFKRHLKVKKSKIHGYNLDFLNEKTKSIHHSLIGSIENSENVARAFINAPGDSIPNNQYDFLNTRVKVSANGVDNKYKLGKLNLGYYNYSNEDDIARYCENLLG